MGVGHLADAGVVEALPEHPAAAEARNDGATPLGAARREKLEDCAMLLPHLDHGLGRARDLFDRHLVDAEGAQIVFDFVIAGRTALRPSPRGRR